MPDDRLFHKRLGHSEKVNSLTDFEELVWRQYIHSADDFGVMRFSAITLQADSDRMASKPLKAVLKALEHVHNVGLVRTFEHQGRTYCCQLDWQNYQRIKYPRGTMNPKPPDELLAECSHATRQLFAQHPGGWGKKKSETLEEYSPNVSETFPKRSLENTSEPLVLAISDSRKPLAIATSQEPKRAKGHQAHRYCGVNFCVSEIMHAKFFQELGAKRESYDLDDAYRRFDGENPTIDNLLPWLKARISAEVGSSEPQIGARTAALARATAGFLRGDE